jgi:nucleoid-associated protein YgaU
MAIFDFFRNAGEKIFGKDGSSAGGSSGRSSAGGGKQQEQFASGASGQQAGGASGSAGSQQSARGASSGQPGTGAQASGGAGAGASRAASQSGAGGRDGQQQGEAIRDYMRSNDAVDVPDDLVVMFDADDGIVILTGTVPDEDTAEVLVLIAGNIDGVSQVDDRMQRRGNGESRNRSRLHRVSEGDTTASLARQYYSDENQAGRIADANRAITGGSGQLRANQTIRIPQDGGGAGSGSAAGSSPGAGMSGKPSR